MVAGGSKDTGFIRSSRDTAPTNVSAVEVFNLFTKQWVSAPPLPMGCGWPTPTVVGDTLYLLKGTVNVVCISLSALVSLASTTPLAPPPTWEVVEMVSLPYSTIARMYPLHIPDAWGVPRELHLSSSTFICLRNRLLVVGGRNEDKKPISAICLYNPRTQQKTKIGDLPALLCECACAVLPSGKLMVLGGVGECGYSRDVFIAKVE